MKYINPYMLFTGSMVPNWLMRRNEISAGAKLTYARLCQYAGDHGVAWPTVSTLASEVGLKERQVQYILAELETCGLIHRQQTDFSKPNEIRFLQHEWMEGCKILHGGGAEYVVPGVQDVAPKENQGRESFNNKKGSRQTRLTDDWMPSETDLGWARDKHPSVNTGTETEKFKNYHIAKGSLMASWSRAWMTWITNAEEFNAKRNRTSPSASSIRPAYDRDESLQRILAAAGDSGRRKHDQ